MHEVCGAGSELSQGFPSLVLVPAKHTGENSPGGKLKREFDTGHWVTGTVWVVEAGNLFLHRSRVCAEGRSHEQRGSEEAGELALGSLQHSLKR